MAKTTKKTGFSLPEMLFALALLAALMAAVAAAVHASLTSFEENEEVASVTQSARWALHRMVGDVRTARAVSTTGSRLIVIPPDDGSGVDQIEYDYQQGVLYYRRTVAGDTTSEVIVGDGDIALNLFYVSYEMGEDWQGVMCLSSVTVRMEFAVDEQLFAMTASAAPRRNQLY